MAIDETQASAQGNAADNAQGAGTETGAEQTGAETQTQENATDVASLGTQTSDESGLEAEKDANTNLGETQEDIFAKDYIGKPENGYDYKEVLPEGWGLNEELAGKFNDIAGKYNMANKGANEIMALAVDLAKQTQDGVLSAQSQAIEADKIKYNDAVINDPDMGGAKLDETLRLANDAYTKCFQKTELHNIFTKLGLNGHPDLVRHCRDLGESMKDDTIHSAGSSTAGKKTPAEIIFGSTEKK